ncbi:MULTISPECIES: DcaP family trimeric outer membrane transporter [Oceanospirillaceae]|uniref:DcaP family trimeric outer membrane transporter n=1 Tax=Oceanobacter antarcticus TaxID=3133425 RepID=A0ABW8NFV7_9GAMM
MKYPCTSIALILAGQTLTLASPFAFADSTATDTPEALQQRLTALEHDVETLRQRALVSSDKGALVIGDTHLTIGGYVRGDLVYTDHGVNGKNALLGAPYVKAADDSQSQRLDMTARESRLYIKTRTMAGDKPLSTHLEADFYGSDGTETVSNSHGLRLRHAYGSWGNLLIGQTWSTFMDLAALGDLNAFGQHASAIFVRQTQVRYTQPFSGGSLMLALENPEDGGDDNKTPDLVVRINADGRWGHASLGAVSRELSDGVDHQRASALSLTAKFPLGSSDDVRLQYNQGALGRYMGLGSYPNEDTARPRLQGFDSWGASLALRHVWSPALASTLMMSRTGANDDAAEGGIDTTKSLHANLMWTATAKVRFGAELAKWNVATMSSGEAVEKSMKALQLSTRFMF